MNANRLSIGILLTCLAFTSITSFTGCDTVTSITNWTVGFAKETGEYIYEKAETFAVALSRAWSAFWDEEDVTVDSDNPLKGTYKGTIGCSVAWGEIDEDNPQGKNSLEIKLNNPRMVRSSVDSDWELAPDETDLITSLQEKLMSAPR